MPLLLSAEPAIEARHDPTTPFGHRSLDRVVADKSAFTLAIGRPPPARWSLMGRDVDFGSVVRPPAPGRRYVLDAPLGLTMSALRTQAILGNMMERSHAIGGHGQKPLLMDFEVPVRTEARGSGTRSELVVGALTSSRELTRPPL